MIIMKESLMDYEPVRRMMIDEIPHGIINYAVYIKWLSKKDTECILDLDKDYSDIKNLENIHMDQEYTEWNSEEEINKAKLYLYKLVDITRNKIITSDYYKTHVHRGTPSECERLFSVYHYELKEILEIIKS